MIAALGAGAEQKARFALFEWERSLVVQMVQDAIGRWTQAGLTRCPADKAQEIAAGKYSSGDRVQYVIETIDGMIKAAERGQEPNPIGVLIAQLGLNRKGRIRVVDTPMFVTQRWDAKREIQRKLLLANAALIEATARRTMAAAESRAESRGVARA